ncbi:MAG TPA: hypothetical protein VLH19_04365 [Patescibacteria group bacterium]|nr:hypothetical protein [Patescibacteria group bacterium]
MSNEHAEAARKNLLEQARTHMSESDFACWLAILRGFYQSSQDLEKNASVVKVSIEKGLVSYSGYHVKISLEDFRQFNPEKENVAGYILHAMHTGHWESGVTARSLTFADEDEQRESAVSLYVGVKRRVLKLFEEEKRK